MDLGGLIIITRWSIHCVFGYTDNCIPRNSFPRIFCRGRPRITDNFPSGHFSFFCCLHPDNSPLVALQGWTNLRSYFKVICHLLNRHVMISLLCILCFYLWPVNTYILANNSVWNKIKTRNVRVFYTCL